jgi:TldD protein
MVTDVTTTRSANFRRTRSIGSQETWKMFGTGGDAKGQPTQTNSISHGSPHIRIKKIMVGAAYA